MSWSIGGYGQIQRQMWSCCSILTSEPIALPYGIRGHCDLANVLWCPARSPHPGSYREPKGILPTMPDHALTASTMKDSITWLYPSIEPYNMGRLQVSPVHQIYFE